MTATVRSSARIPATVFVLTLLALLVTTVGRISIASAVTYSTSSYSSRLVQLVNSARAQHGLASLRVASGTTSVAASWTAHLAAQRGLSHNPNLVYDVQHHGSAAATTVAENVGEGAPSDPDGLFTAYMNSPEHRANILDSGLRYIGMAVDFSGGYAWNTMDFVDRYGSSTSTHTTSHAAAPSHHRAPVTHHRTTTTRHAVAKPAPRPAHPAAAPRRPAPKPRPAVSPAARAALADARLVAASRGIVAQTALTGSEVQDPRGIGLAVMIVAVVLVGGVVSANLAVRAVSSR
jgi:uncharacterized protein YkwD